jgi:hypothetical protein
MSKYVKDINHFKTFNTPTNCFFLSHISAISFAANISTWEITIVPHINSPQLIIPDFETHIFLSLSPCPLLGIMRAQYDANLSIYCSLETSTH